MTEAENELNRLVIQIEEYKKEFNAILGELQMIESTIAEIDSTKEALDSIAYEQNILLPLGSNVYARGKITDGETVIIGVGAEIFVEKTISDAKITLDKRKDDAKKAADKLRKDAEKIGDIIQQINAKIEKMYQAKRNNC